MTNIKKYKFKMAEYDEELKYWKLSRHDENGDRVGGDVIVFSSDEVTEFLQTNKKFKDLK